MKDMKSHTNVENKLSLSLRFALVLSLVLTQTSVTRVTASPSLRPQFVLQALPLTQSKSLSYLAVSPIPDPMVAPLLSLSNESSVGCAPIARHRMCSCYHSDEGLLIDCNIEAIYQMRDVLTLFTDNSQHIKSFSVYSINQSLNQTLNSLPERLFSNISSIEQIYISVPSLVNVSVNAFEGLEQSLKTLSLVNSKLQAIPVLALNRCKQLSALDLESNDIQDIEPYAFHGLALTALNLKSNRINKLLTNSFGGLEKTLSELVLIGNRIDVFPLQSLRKLQSLQSLKLQSNQITSIATEANTRFSSLKTLDLTSNLIDRLDPESLQTFPKLVSLSMADNKLTNLSNSSSIFSHLLDLETLDLSHNELRVVHMNAINSLRTVDFSYNRLQDIRFNNLLSLKEVFLSNNNVFKLTNNTFNNCDNLSVIFLQNNAISAIDYNTFQSLQHLLTLDLSSNQLKAIDSQLFRHNTGLQSLYLDNNPFHCDCRLLSMYEWLESHSRLLALNDREDMLCSEPERLKHNSILSLHTIDFCPVPLISLMEISNLESTKVRIKWEVQNNTLVGGFTLEYYLSDDRTPPLTHKYLGAFERHSDIIDLRPEHWYTVCIQANGKQFLAVSQSDNKPIPEVIDENKNIAEYVTRNRKCSQVRTLSHSEPNVISLSALGIIVGLVVFVVLMLTLSVLLFFAYKMRAKRRRPLKADVPEEYITYRHFSLPSSENIYS